MASWARGLEEEVEARVRVPVGKGFAGRVAATRSPVYIPDVRRAEVVNPLLREARADLAARRAAAGRGPAAGRPARRLGHARVFANDDERTLQLLADRIALAIEQSSLYESARAAGRRLEFLAEASELLGSTLDYSAALERLSELAVPYLGDWCIVDMLRGERLERVAVAHADPEAQAAAYEFLKRFPITPDAAHGPGLVIATGRAELISEVTDEHLQRASGGDPEYLEALRAIGMTSLLCAPLIARGRVLGTITMLSEQPDRLYGPADLVTTEELARRAAAAVDNALLFREAERRADAARVLEHIGDGVFMLDRDGVVRLWNRAAESVTRLPADEVVGRPAARGDPRLGGDRRQRAGRGDAGDRLERRDAAARAAGARALALDRRGRVQRGHRLRLPRPDRRPRARGAAQRLRLDRLARAAHAAGRDLRRGADAAARGPAARRDPEQQPALA